MALADEVKQAREAVAVALQQLQDVLNAIDGAATEAQARQAQAEADLLASQQKLAAQQQLLNQFLSRVTALQAKG